VSGAKRGDIELPYVTGVHRTSETQTPLRRRSLLTRGFIVPLAAVVLALTAQLAPASPAVSQAAAGTQLKAVFVVGPTHEQTQGNLDSAEWMARQAEAAGMDVRRVFFPHATWENVLAQAQGANLLVYMGHGYGWPSPYTKTLTESRQDGMGLNAFDGSGPAEYKYYGATPIRQNIRLAPNAVVVLMHGCYTAGSGEPGMANPSVDVARQRVDNFASGFLAAGAGAVFALAWGTRIDLPLTLMTTDQTMDGVFRTPGDHVGFNDMYFDSVRTPGTKNHLDPSSDGSYHRAISGRLNMTTAEWRAGAGQMVPPPPPPPGVPVIEMPVPSKNQFFNADSDGILPSTTFKMKLAVPSNVVWQILDASGATVRTIKSGQQVPAGTSSFVWNGRADSGAAAPDGWYRSVATAQTPSGSFTSERTVFHGAFQLNPVTSVAVRGTSLKLNLVSTEPLSGVPTVQVSQPGQATRTFNAKLKSGRKYTVTIPMLPGDTGTVWFVVSGRDKAGGWQSSAKSLPLN
jgi:hypothetical protein